MKKSFWNRLGLVTTEQAKEIGREAAEQAEKAARDKFPDWYLEYAGAHQYDVPAPETYAAQADLMAKVSYLYTVITLTAQSAASQDFDVYNGTRPVESSRMETLLKSPNPNQTGFEFLRDHFTYKLLNGGSYWWINSTSPEAEPVEIWLIPPGNIYPVPDDKLGIKEYMYLPGDGQEIPLPTWQIVWFRGFHPSNQFASLSGLVPLSLAMKTDIQTQQYLSTVYGPNNGRLPGILAFKSPVNDVDWRRIKQDALKASKENSYMFLRGVGDGISWLNAASTVKEMETLNGRRMTQEDIYNTFAPGLMNMTSVNATEANAVTGKKTFAEFTLYPLLTDTSQKINKELSSRFGGMTIEFDDPRITDRALEMAEITQTAQFAKVNEIRRDKLKLDPLPPTDPRGELFAAQITPAVMPTQPESAQVLPTAPQETTAPEASPSAMQADALSAELMKWQRYEINHFGQKCAPFDTRKVSPRLALNISADLRGAKSIGDIQSIFAQAGRDVPLLVLADALERMSNAN